MTLIGRGTEQCLLHNVRLDDGCQEHEHVLDLHLLCYIYYSLDTVYIHGGCGRVDDLGHSVASVCYSYLRAAIGSIFAARRAGIQLANSEAAPSKTTDTAILTGSTGLTP